MRIGAFKYVALIPEGSKVKTSISFPEFNKNTGTFGDDLSEEEISKSMPLANKYIVVNNNARPSMKDSFKCVWKLVSNGGDWYWDEEPGELIRCCAESFYKAYIKEPEEWRK